MVFCVYHMRKKSSYELIKDTVMNHIEVVVNPIQSYKFIEGGEYEYTTTQAILKNNTFVVGSDATFYFFRKLCSN